MARGAGNKHINTKSHREIRGPHRRTNSKKTTAQTPHSPGLSEDRSLCWRGPRGQRDAPLVQTTPSVTFLTAHPKDHAELQGRRLKGLSLEKPSVTSKVQKVF